MSLRAANTAGNTQTRLGVPPAGRRRTMPPWHRCCARGPRLHGKTSPSAPKVAQWAQPPMSVHVSGLPRRPSAENPLRKRRNLAGASGCIHRPV